MGEKEPTSTKPEMWTKEQIKVLIGAFEKEQQLYVSNIPKYFNKRLRRQALKRVHCAVLKLRPNTTLDECQRKIKLFRNQYNRENIKIQNSLQRGAGPNDVYIPNLWFYDQIKFLGPYVIPRKKRSSLKRDGESPVSEGEDYEIISNMSEDSQPLEEVIKQEDIEPHTEMTSGCEQEQLPVCTPTAAGPSDPISPTSSKSSRLRTSLKEFTLNSSSDELSNKTDSANPLGQSTLKYENTGKTSASEKDPTVNGFLTFLGALVRSFQNEELRLEAMNAATQTVLKAKLSELRRTKR